MGNEIAKRDDNRVPVILGTGNDGDGEVLRLLVNITTKRLLVDAITSQQGHTAVGDGTKTVTSAGSRVQLDNQSCKRVWIGAHESNAGTIVVGGVTVVAALATRRGSPLYPTQGDWFNVSNMNLLYIDSTASGDKVNFYFEN